MTNSILDLPFDVLYIIFTLCWEKNLPTRRHFPIILSHVCQKWRQYALETPSFWVALNFRDYRHDLKLEKYRAWLERSGEAPLTIVFGPEPFKQRSVKNAKNIMRLILPHSNRWKSLEILNTPRKIIRVIFDRLLDVPLPSLAKLEVGLQDPIFWREPTTKWRFRPFLVGGAPNLREIIVKRLSYNYIDNRFRSLAVLDIFDRDMTFERPPAIALKIHHLLSRLPHLQALRLRTARSSPRYEDHNGVHSVHSIAQPLTHPSLVELSIEALPSTRNTIISSLILTEVRYFVDRSRANPKEWEITLDLSCLRHLDQSRPFPKLVSLRLGGNRSMFSGASRRPGNGGHLEYLAGALEGLPGLKALTFVQIDWLNGYYLHCLARVCPELQWMTLVSCSGYTLMDLRSMIEERQKLGPVDSIKRIAVCGLPAWTETSPELEAREWLEGALEFSYKPETGIEEPGWDYLSNVERLL